MRMRKRQNLAPRMEACRSVWLEDATYLRGNWRSLMPQARELRLEIGCGKGKFTVETAALEPDVLFVAVERVQEALVLAMEKALSMGLKNVYFLSIDAAKLEEYFAPGEVDLIYLNFCDPWPRKKNAPPDVPHLPEELPACAAPERGNPLQDGQRTAVRVVARRI